MPTKAAQVFGCPCLGLPKTAHLKPTPCSTIKALRNLRRHSQRQSWQTTLRALQKQASTMDSAAQDTRKASSSTKLEAKDVILQFYDYYNASDIDGVMSLMAEDCKYHDMIYLEPFEGHEEIRAYFEKVTRTVPPDLKFFVEHISGGDPHFVGVKWHVDINGNEFPFSRGCSFYEVNDQGKITAARDLVEPAIKPGTAALQGLKVMAPIVRKLGPKANPGILKTIPIKSYLFWAFYAVYASYVFLGTAAPGEPVWNTPQETWTWILNDSINFFYVNIFAKFAGLPSIPTPDGVPVSEALFNFVNAWSLMFLPLILSDSKRKRVDRKVAWWTGFMFLTNAIMVPYMALRERLPESKAVQRQEKPRPLPSYSKIIGGTAFFIAGVSAVWLFAGRPEFGGLDARWGFAVEQFNGNRAFWAFVLDLGLYSVWQAFLMADCGAPKRLQNIPFFGLATWLLTGSGDLKKGLQTGFWDPEDK